MFRDSYVLCIYVMNSLCTFRIFMYGYVTNDINMRLANAWTAIDRLSIIWKSVLSDKIKRNFFQEEVESILLYRCTTWTLTKGIEKKLDENCTRMLQAILNISWRQHSTKQQLSGHLIPICKTIQIRRKRHTEHCWRIKDKIISDVLLWTHFTQTCKCWPRNKNLSTALYGHRI